MIKLYTSYYANIKNIPANYLMVGISQFCPEWLKDNAPDNFLFMRGNFLAPTKELLNDIKSGNIDQFEYRKRYEEQFDEFFKNASYQYKTVDQWYQAMDEEFSDKYQAIVFLCYEKPSDFCHRHILRDILNHKHHIRIEEFAHPEEIKENKEPKTKPLF